MNKGVNQHSKYVTQAQQQRPQPPTVTLTWHACKYKVHKLHQRYILHSWFRIHTDSARALWASFCFRFIAFFTACSQSSTSPWTSRSCIQFYRQIISMSLFVLITPKALTVTIFWTHIAAGLATTWQRWVDLFDSFVSRMRTVCCSENLQIV